MDPLVTVVRTDADGIRFTFSRLSGILVSGLSFIEFHSVYRWGEGENVSELLGARSRNEKKAGNKRKGRSWKKLTESSAPRLALKATFPPPKPRSKSRLQSNAKINIFIIIDSTSTGRALYQMD